MEWRHLKYLHLLVMRVVARRREYVEMPLRAVTRHIWTMFILIQTEDVENWTDCNYLVSSVPLLEMTARKNYCRYLDRTTMRKNPT